MIELNFDKASVKDLEEAAKILSARQFGDAVARRIKELKWTQQDLANAIFTGQPVISQIVRGAYPNLTLDWVTRIAKALKMPPSELAKAYWIKEDAEMIEEERTTLEKIRELLTQHYQIGGDNQEEKEIDQLPPHTTRYSSPKLKGKTPKADKLSDEQEQPEQDKDQDLPNENIPETPENPDTETGEED